MPTNTFKAFAAALLIGQATAHTWLEQLNVISQGGTFVGNYGYPRAFVARDDSGFNGESNVYILPAADSGRTRVNDSDMLCKDTQRTTSTQNEKWPRLQAAPGDYIAMKYSENGHVTLPDNQKGKPQKGGTVFLYGTSEPKDDEKLTTVLKWTKDGKGGDGRGVLLGTNNYDDERCYQINDSEISKNRQQKFPDPNPDQPGSVNEQYCESNLQIPTDVKSGKPYTIYWVWQWPTEAGQDPGLPDGKDEWYTTCSDVDIVAANSNAKQFASGSTEQKYKLGQQDPQSKAVSDYQSRSALTSDPAQGMEGGATSAGSAGAATSAASSPAAATPAVSTPAVSTPAVSTPVATPTTPAYTNNNGNGNAGDAPKTVYITVTETPSTSSFVTQMVTVTAEVPVATLQQTTTTTMNANVNFAGKSKRSFTPRAERRKARQSASVDPADLQAAKENYCKQNPSDKGACLDGEEQVEEIVRRSTSEADASSPASSSASSVVSMPSLMMLSCFFTIFAYAFA